MVEPVFWTPVANFVDDLEHVPLDPVPVVQQAAHHDDELHLVEDDGQIPFQVGDQFGEGDEEDSGDEFDLHVGAGDDTVEIPNSSTPNRLILNEVTTAPSPLFREPAVTPILIRLPRPSASRSASSSPAAGPSAATV